MAKFCGDRNSAPILEAAGYWRDECLLRNNSIFGDRDIWTIENTEQLTTNFVDNPDAGDGDFNKKLEQQIAPVTDKAKQLAAEMIWVMMLCPSNVRPNKKRENINTILSWLDKKIDESHKFFSDSVLDGIGSGGPGYSQYRWKELVYCINFTKAFLALSDRDKQQLITNGKDFSEWLETIEDNENRQFRHMLLFLLFPDDHERIFGKSDRLNIAAAFSGKSRSQLSRLKSRELDQILLDLRKEQETEYGTDQLDWYVPPLSDKWQRTTPKQTEELTELNVIDAIVEIDSRGINADEKSTTYDLIYAGKRYPPKLVYSLACKYKDGVELDRSTFEGGENTKCFNDLRSLGFVIEMKNYVNNLLTKFITQAKTGTNLKYGDYKTKYCGLDVKAGFGQGVLTYVPWISFTGYDQTTSNGIYPVYLYYRSIDVLILAYGISETNVPTRQWNNIHEKESVENYLRSRHDHKAEKFGESYVHSVYVSPADFSDQKYTSNLDALIYEYHELMGGVLPKESGPSHIPPKPTENPIMDPSAIASSFSIALNKSHVNFGENHESRVSAFIASLLTKPLVILTGLSGSGKTQIAIRFGEWLGKDRMFVAPVRPDWTGAEALFGYEDALKPVKNANAAWAAPETLQFLLKAASDPYYPYLLVLDEMNLAHVERYFADVLSGMESNQPCLPNLVRESDGYWRLKQNAPDKIILPNNVFIVGTVNVDETTYMFSPKVLDRANTFEFRVTAGDLSDSYIKPVKCASGEIGLIRGFLEIGRNSTWQADNPFSGITDLLEKMRQIHNILSKQGFEFGHRVFYESQRFAAIYSATAEVDIANVLDLIIMQKLLPRLHGSRRRLEDLIRTLAEFCFNNATVDQSENPVSTFEPDNYKIAEAKLPISFDKLKRMLRSLRANQFTSFTE